MLHVLCRTAGLVTRETEYRDPTDRDHVLAAEEKQKGYK
jgi:hypothetical protein